MTTIAPLSRDIGQAERSLRALLDQVLEDAQLTFPEWTVLFGIDTAGPASRGELIQRQIDGVVAAPAEATDSVDAVVLSGLVGPAHEAGGSGDDAANPPLALTEAGEAFFRPLWATVSGITMEIHDGLPPEDVEATRRTLAEMSRRAAVRLASRSN